MRLGGFSSHHGSNWVVVQSTWLKRELVDGIFKNEFQEREFIFPKRERELKRGA